MDLESTVPNGVEKKTTNIFVFLRRILADSEEAVVLLVIVVLFLFFSLFAPNFLSFYALSNVLTFASIFGIVVVGMAVLMISGEFDLSVGSVLAVAAYVFLFALRAGIPPVIALLLALVSGAVMGLINGILVVTTGIPSFIATLGTMLAYRGIAHALGKGESIVYTPEQIPFLLDALNGYISPINKLADPPGNIRAASFWFIAAVIVMTYILMRTRYGNWVFSTGGNPGAALAQGVNVKRVKLINFVISGFMAGLAGTIMFAQRRSMYELVGENLELIAIAAAVIGGVSLWGGSGTIVGAALGMILLSMVEQGLILMGVPNDVFRGVVGVIIIVSVVAHKYLREQY